MSSNVHCVPSICAESSASLRTYIVRYMSAFGTKRAIPAISPSLREQAASVKRALSDRFKGKTLNKEAGLNER